jgi:CRP/FNR family transcriptional regulator, dissimilatory nitrate respiration regulator
MQQLEEFMTIPGNVSLFEGVSPDDISRLLACLAIRQRSCRKGETVLREGDSVDSFGIVLNGSVQLMRSDRAGNRIILAAFGAGSLFAESLACAGTEQSPVSVVAREDTNLLFLPYKKLLRTCESACSFHARVIENMLTLLARKNILLNARIEIAAKRTTREKVLAFLDQERRAARSKSFTVRYTRSELADYLCVDRSALSRELSVMQKDGLFQYDRNDFILP